MNTKLRTKKIPYTFVRGGYYYFTRRVPSDLSTHYSYPRIVKALKTRSSSEAQTLANKACADLDQYWSYLRLSENTLLGGKLHIRRTTDCEADSEQQTGISLEFALETYLKIRGCNKGKTFTAAAERSCKYLVESVGSKTLQSYTRLDALKYREYLSSRGLSGSSILRIYTTLNSIINFSISEYALSFKNPFIGVYFDRTKDVKKRQPFTVDAIRTIQLACRERDDDIRWLIALISDTGMRLSEAAGLDVTDIKCSTSIPHLVVRAHPWRSLKTSASERVIPLVGASMWAAERIMEHTGESSYAFPRYNKELFTNGNSASSSINKWIKELVETTCTVHSFRHSLRDRLRAVNCPEELMNQLGGWSQRDVGARYGEGYDLSAMHTVMLKIVSSRGSL